MQHIPDGWPGTGEPPTIGELHVSPFTEINAEWQSQSILLLMSTKMDHRRRRTCVRALCHLCSHIQSEDSLEDGSPFASVSANQLSKELGVKLDTARSALRTLTNIGVLQVVWRPKKGERKGTCYKFVMPDVPDNSTEKEGKSGQSDVPDKPTEKEGKSDIPDKPSEVPDSPSEVPDSPSEVPARPSEVPDSPTEKAGTDSLSRSLSEEREREMQEQARSKNMTPALTESIIKAVGASYQQGRRSDG